MTRGARQPAVNGILQLLRLRRMAGVARHRLGRRGSRKARDRQDGEAEGGRISLSSYDNQSPVRFMRRSTLRVRSLAQDSNKSSFPSTNARSPDWVPVIAHEKAPADFDRGTESYATHQSMTRATLKSTSCVPQLSIQSRVRCEHPMKYLGIGTGHHSGPEYA